MVRSRFGKAGCALGVLAVAGAAWGYPYATQIVDYTPGNGAASAYMDPQSALGEPTRFTGVGTFPSVVSIFSPPFGTDEIVSIGDGGSLTVQFSQPVPNDASNPYGVDLIVFGNTGFIDADWPNGQIGTPAGLFGADGGKIEVSADGISFYEIPNVLANGLFPTQGYLDSGPFDGVPGSVPSNFRRPVDPSLTLSDFDGLTYAQALALYDGSGGGVPIDLSWAVDGDGFAANLASISFVRVSHSGAGSVEIDAFVAVPEPGAIALLAFGAIVPLLRPRRVRQADRFRRSVR